jgi:hypothetical protein
MRMIIDIADNLDILNALDDIKIVIAQGKISNHGKNYCYASVLHEKWIYADRTKNNTFKFRVEKDIKK